MQRRANWDFVFEGATGWFGRQPSYAPAGQFPMLAGVDGRYDGVLRRYPGHIRFPDDGDVLGPGQTYSPDICKYFEVQAGIGSADHVRGFAVGDLSAGTIELWFRRTGDTSGTIRKQVVTLPAIGTAATVNTATTAVTRLQGPPIVYETGGPAGHEEIPITTALLYSAADPDTHGEVLYQAVSEGRIGSQHVGNGVVRQRPDGSWEKVGEPRFNNFVNVLIEYNGEIYALGNFTAYGDTDIGGIAKWDGTDWVSPNFGNVADTSGSIIINCAAVFNNKLYFGGLFDKVDDVDADNMGWISTMASAGLSGTSGVSGSTSSKVLDVIAWDDGGGLKLWWVGEFDKDGTGTTSFPEHIAYRPLANPALFRPGALGSPDLNDKIALGVYDSGSGEQLYVARAGGNVDTWDTTNNWAAKFTTDDDVRLMVTAGGNLVLLGAFTTIDSGAATGIAVHNGSSLTRNTSTAFTTSVLFGAAVSSTGVLAAGTLNMGTGENVVDVDELWDICTVGPYIYLFTEKIEHAVLTYDPTTDLFSYNILGPGRTWLPKPTVSPGEGDNGYSIAGQYAAAYRLWDVKRGRYTVLSDLSDSLLMVPDQPLEVQSPTGLGTLPAGFDRIQYYQTLSSSDDSVPAGGTRYRAGAGKLGVTPLFDVQLMSKKPLVGGSKIPGNEVFPLDDATLPDDPQRQFDFFRDNVGEAGRVVACEHYQGTTFVLEKRDAFLDIRWSATHRFEPESFSDFNVYATRIPARAGLTCRFVRVGDYLFLVGGSSIYRIEKKGRVVAIVELHGDHPILHRNGVVAVGNNLYVATEEGIMFIDARSGNATIIRGLDRLFYDRWRPLLTPAVVGGQTDRSLRAGYDSKMQALYWHLPAADETLVVWLGTGKVTLLTHHAVSNLASGPDLELETSVRCYFLTDKRWFTSANWNPTDGVPETMTGIGLIPNEGARYNVPLSAVDTSSATTVLQIAGLVLRDLVDVPFYVGFLSGPHAGNIYKVTSVLQASGNTLLWLSEDLSVGTPPNVGDVIAFSPVEMTVVGASLWGPGRAPAHLNRKTGTGMTVMPTLVESRGGPLVTQKAPVDSTYGLLEYGFARHTDLVDAEPLTGPSGQTVTMRTKGSSPEGATLSINRPEDNWEHSASFTADGTLLYPVLRCLSSNLSLELDWWRVTGVFSDTQVVSA